MNKKRVNRRRGLSLLELIIATAMLGMIMATVTLVIRTSRVGWEAHEADYTRIEAAHATLRHIVRDVRQADGVAAIAANRLTLDMPNGDRVVWEHSGTTVNYGITTPTSLLADQITSVTFTGKEADGSTTTTTPSDVQCLEIDVTVTLPRDTNPTRTVSSMVWVRSW